MTFKQVSLLDLAPIGKAGVVDAEVVLCIVEVRTDFAPKLTDDCDVSQKQGGIGGRGLSGKERRNCRYRRSKQQD